MPRVDKIVGPGNRFVAAAKALVAADCGIDFYAGPDRDRHRGGQGPGRRGSPPTSIAQAEHDPDARAVLITPIRRWPSASAAAVAGADAGDGPARASMRRTAASS